MVFAVVGGEAGLTGVASTCAPSRNPPVRAAVASTWVYTPKDPEPPGAPEPPEPGRRNPGRSHAIMTPRLCR